MTGFRKFMMRGDFVVVAVGLVMALAFSGLVKAFTTDVISPIVNRAQGGHPIALGVQLGTPGSTSTFINLGSLIAAVVYFVTFVVVVYVAIVLPYRRVQARRGVSVFGDPPPVKTCPYCLSGDLPVAATKCAHCASTLPATEEQPAAGA